MGSFLDQIKAQAQVENDGVQATQPVQTAQPVAEQKTEQTQAKKPRGLRLNKGKVVEEVNLDELSEQGKENYEQMNIEEKKAFLLSKGVLDNEAPEYNAMLKAVDEGRPIVVVAVGTTGLNKSREQEAYDENGNHIGKRPPFAENAVTNIGVAVYKPNEEGKYALAEQFIAIPDEIRESAIQQVAIEEHHGKGKNYQSYLKKNPENPVSFADFDENGYNALTEGGFGVPVGQGGWGFTIDNRKESEFCMPLKDISDKVNALVGGDAFVVSNMQGLQGEWFARNGMHLDLDPIQSNKVFQQFVFADTKNEPILKKDGTPIDRVSLNAFIDAFDIERPQYKAIDRALTIGDVLTEMIERAEKVREAEQGIEKPTEKAVEAPVKEETPVQDSTIKGQSVPNRTGEQQSPLESVGALGDVGMSVAPSNDKVDRVGLVVNLMVDGNAFPSMAERKALLMAVSSTVDGIADQIKNIIGHTIPVAKTEYAFNDDGHIQIQIPFVVVPSEVEDVKKFATEITSQPDVLKTAIAFYGAYDKAQAERLGNIQIGTDTQFIIIDDPEVVTGERFAPIEQTQQAWLAVTEQGVNEILSTINQYAEKPEEIPVFDIQKAKEARAERNGETIAKPVQTMQNDKDRAEAIEKTVEAQEKAVEVQKQAEIEAQKIEAEKEVQKENADMLKEIGGITTAVTMLITTIQKPILDKVDELKDINKEQSDKIAELSAVIGELKAINEQQSKEIGGLTKQNEILQSKVESAINLINENTKSQQVLLSKQIELSTQLQSKNKDKVQTKENDDIKK